MKYDELLRAGPFTGVPVAVLQTPVLTPRDKVVYAVLLSFLGANDCVWPSQLTIANRASLSARAVRRSIKQLADVGLIAIDGASGTSNHCSFNNPSVLTNIATPATDGRSMAKSGHSTPAKSGHSMATDGRIPRPRTADKIKTGNKTTKEKQVEINSLHTPACGRTPPAAAERAKPISTSLTKDVGWLELLKTWKRQHRPLPEPAKLEICRKLLAVQQRQTGETFDASVIEPGTSLDFVNLFKRAHTGRYCWQEMATIAAIKTERKIYSKSLKQAKVVELDRAEEIYLAYPRRLKKVAALKEIRAAMKRLQALDASEDAAAFLLERTKLFAASPEGQKGKWVPYPATWFRDGRYGEDEKEWYTTENRSGSLQREIPPADEVQNSEPSQTWQELCDMLNKSKTN